jgi:hypothetical protein
MQGSGVYPGPLTELDFWVERAGNLNSVHEQLCGEKIQKVVKVLQLANSTYHPAFERLFQVGIQQLLLTHRAWRCAAVWRACRIGLCRSAACACLHAGA